MQTKEENRLVGANKNDQKLSFMQKAEAAVF